MVDQVIISNPSILAKTEREVPLGLGFGLEPRGTHFGEFPGIPFFRFNNFLTFFSLEYLFKGPSF